MAYEYNNICFTLTGQARPDPWMIKAFNKYYLTFTAGNRVEIRSSPDLLNWKQTNKPYVIWTPPPNTNHSDGLWAPELHCLQGRWYVYYAAANPAYGNVTHRTYILGGPPADRDPCEGPWEFLGGVRGIPDQWSIDATIFQLDGHMYMVYSGWPFHNPTKSDLIQQLFIIRLSDPITAATQPVCICKPDQKWEISHDGNGAHGINEGPTWLESPDKKWRGLVYSCAGSWTSQYKMAVLHYMGGDPMNPRSWRKAREPLVQTGPYNRGPYGPGHGSFIHLGNETLAVFHATDGPREAWGNRKARCQRVTFDENGPYMGKYVGEMTNDHEAFTKPPPRKDPPNSGGLRGGVKAFAHDIKDKIR